MTGADRAGVVGVEPCDTEWAAARAAEALRYLGNHYPECLDALRVLDEHETAAHQAAMSGDEVAYLEALRAYCRAGRDAALEIRRGGGVSATAGELVGFAAALLAAVVSFCIYVMGVFSRDRAISRVGALVFCICAAVAIWTLARVLL
jgi:hypothetical protein